MIDHLTPFDDAALDAVAAVIDSWVEQDLAANPLVAAARRDPLEPRWWVMARGEAKSDIAVWFWLRQRTVEFESAFMPPPLDKRDEVFELLLRRNAVQVGVAFDIGSEGGVFLRGHLANGAVSPDALDAALGAVYAATEAVFRRAVRIGFASMFDD